MPAPAASVEVVTPHERAVAIEVDADFVPGAAPRAAARVREGRDGRSVVGPFLGYVVGSKPVSRRFPVARLYRTSAGSDFALFPIWQQAGRNGDRFDYPFVVRPCRGGSDDACGLTVTLSRSLASCFGIDETFLIEAGTWLIANALELQALREIPKRLPLHTGNVDSRAGSNALLDRLMLGSFGVPAGPPDHDIFLSYASPDAERVRQLAETLKALGVGVWIDREQITYGAVVQDVIDQGIVNARFFGFVITPASLAERPWVRYEQSNAWQRELSEGRVIVIPILMEGELGDLPEKYRKKRCVDLRGERAPAELQDLARFLAERRTGHARQSTGGVRFGRATFPVISIDSELVDSGRGRVHRYELGLRARNASTSPIEGFSIDIWFPALACCGNEGFGEGLGTAGDSGLPQERVGVRWRAREPLLPGQQSVVCPSQTCHHPYRVDDGVFHALGSWAEMRVDVFAATGPPMRCVIPWERLHIF